MTPAPTKFHDAAIPFQSFMTELHNNQEPRPNPSLETTGQSQTGRAGEGKIVLTMVTGNFWPGSNMGPLGTKTTENGIQQ